MKLPLIGLALLAFLSMVSYASASTVTLTKSGIALDAGTLGKFNLSYPGLDAGGGPKTADINGDAVDLTYSNGTKIHGTLSKGGDIAYEFTNVPDETKKIRIETTFPESIMGTAKYAVDAAEAKLFPTTPASTDAEAFLSRADSKKFAVSDAKDDKEGFTITMPYGWMQLQDNRFWHGHEFLWFVAMDLHPTNGKTNLTFNISGAPGQAITVKSAPLNLLAVKLTDKAIGISNGTAGQLDLNLPTILVGDKSIASTETKLAADAKSLDITYPDGTTANIAQSGKEITISFKDLPKGATAFKIDSLIPFNYSNGGTYSIGGEIAKPFPKEKPAKPFLYQGNASTITLIHPTGTDLHITLPPFSYQQLQDNREWNWSIFGWMMTGPLAPDETNQSFTIKFDGGNSPTSHAPMVDRFGQWVASDFPTKVKSEDELKQDAIADKDWLATLKPPATDVYGGLSGSGEKLGLKKTGFFHLANIKRPGPVGGNTDILVTPDGNAFFQLGVCSISPCDDYTTVAGRESIYEWLPGRDQATKTAIREGNKGVVSFYIANTIRKFGQPYNLDTHFGRMIDRLRTWGFNSSGAFAAIPPVVHTKRFPYVNFIPIPAPPLGKINQVWDPFAPDLAAKFDAAYSKSVAVDANDPLLIGYFITNEPLIEDVPKTVPTLKASECPSKSKLISMLEEKYKTIEAFNTAWNTKFATFADAGEQPLAVTTKAAASDMGAFFQAFLEARYSLVNTAFRKYDPNHLLIGDRWMPGTANSEVLVKTAAKYLDIISINYYTYGIDKNFLDRIHTWAQKPLLFSEWYFACPDQGLRGGSKVNTQTERGLAYRNYIEQSAALGYVVGSQWFSAIDQAPTGRFFEGFNGEAANIGLVNVADRPYKDFLNEAMKTNYTLYDVILGNRPAFAFDDPRFAIKRAGSTKNVDISRMVKKFVLNGSRADWPSVPGNRIGAAGLVQGRDAEGFEATFRLAYDDTNLYVFVEVTDPTPMMNTQKPENIWNADAIELFIGSEDLNQGGSLKFSDRQILIRGAKSDDVNVYFSNAPKQYPAQSIVVPNLDGKGYTVEAAIPFEALGFSSKDVTEFLFDIAVDDSDTGTGRTRQLVYNGNARNSKDRGAWGRATLVK